MGTGTDVLQELTDDHRRIRASFRELMEEPPGDQRRKHLLNELTVDLVRHLALEESFLHPAVRRCLSDGEQLAQEQRHANAEVADLLRELEHREARDRDFDQLLTLLHNRTVTHIDTAHHSVFAQLRQHCPRRTREELGDGMREAVASLTAARPPRTGPGLVDRARAPLAEA